MSSLDFNEIFLHYEKMQCAEHVLASGRLEKEFDSGIFVLGQLIFAICVPRVMVCKVSVMLSLPLSMVISIGIEMILDMHFLIARHFVMCLASLPIGSQK
jgi:hypothetical protein